MKASVATSLLFLIPPLASSLALPQSDLTAFGERDAAAAPNIISDVTDLEKRRGGGGGGSKGGSGSSSGSSSSGSSSDSSGSSSGSVSSGSSSKPKTPKPKTQSGGKGSSSSTGSKGSSGSSGSSSGSKSGSGSTSSSSNTGGSTKSGSGTAKTYGGGTYYPGGATTPYSAGSRSASGIAPYVLTGAALGFAAGAAWHYPYAYAYPYSSPYYYHTPITSTNEHNSTGNYTMNVICYCDEYSECGCDNNNNSTYLNDIIGDPPKNSSVVTIVQNGTNETAYINGTLANGTTSADPNASGAASLLAMPWKGAWPVAVLVSAMMYAL